MAGAQSEETDGDDEQHDRRNRHGEPFLLLPDVTGGRYLAGRLARQRRGAREVWSGPRAGGVGRFGSERRMFSPVGVLVKNPSARNCSDEVWFGSMCRRINSVSLSVTRDFRSALNSVRFA